MLLLCVVRVSSKSAAMTPTGPRDRHQRQRSTGSKRARARTREREKQAAAKKQSSNRSRRKQKPKKTSTHRLRHGVPCPLDVRPEPVPDVRRQPHVDRHEQHSDAARARDGDDVVEPPEDALVVVPRGGLQHKARLLAVAKHADEVEAGVLGLVEHLRHVVVAELLDRGPGRGVAGDLGGLPVEVDPRCDGF